MNGQTAAEIAARLRDQAARLVAAADAAAEVTAEGTSTAGAGGKVAVVATGAGQVAKVSIEPQALRAPLPELGAAAARAVNQAISAVRDRAREADADAADSRAERAAAAAEAERIIGRLAEEKVSASSADRQVAVTANGAGEVQSVRIQEGPLRQPDARGLGERIAEACNGALAEAQRLQQRQADSMKPDAGQFDAMLEDRANRHARQMDALVDQLAMLDRRIDT